MDKGEIKQRLLDEMEKTKETILEYKELTKPESPDVAIGRVSRMDAINNRSVVSAALRTAEDKLIRLERVLEKIDTDEFGICMKCKQPIPVGRILIRPESLLCVRCAG
jgi:DnaK suppressor protein